MSRLRSDICTGIEWVLGIPLSPSIIYGNILYHTRSPGVKTAACLLLWVCIFQVILWVDIVTNAGFITHKRDILASAIVACWVIHTVVIIRIDDSFLKCRAGHIAHLLSYCSAINYVLGLPLSHTLPTFSRLVAVIHVLTCITAIFVAAGFTWFWLVAVPTHKAWGCYPTTNPADFVHGMCSSQPGTNTWWARAQSSASPICSMPSHAINEATCEPRYTAIQKNAVVFHVLHTIGISSIALYLYGCMCAFVAPDDSPNTKQNNTTKEPAPEKKKLLSSLFF